jgi:heme exporter protein D
VTFFLVLVSMVLSNMVFFNLLGDFFRYGFYGFLFWSDLLLLMASYVELLPPVLRRRRQPQVGGSVPVSRSRHSAA